MLHILGPKTLDYAEDGSVFGPIIFIIIIGYLCYLYGKDKRKDN